MNGTRRRYECLLSFPSLIWLLAFFLVPTLIIFSLSLRPAGLYGGIGEGWTLETLAQLWQPAVLTLLFRTLWMSLLTTGICLAISLPIGYYLSHNRQQPKPGLLLALILPFWTSFIVRVYAWKFLLHPEGWVKKLLVICYLVNAGDSLLYRPGTVILVMVYTFLPVAILPIYSAASRFDFQLVEAGRDLGLNPFQAFIRVFVPGIRRGLLTAAILVFIPVLGMYVIPDVVGGPQTEMLGNRVVQRVFVDQNLPEAAALSLLLLLMAIIPILLGLGLERRKAK